MQRHRLGHAVTGAALAAVLALGIATSAAAQGAIGLIYMNGKQGPTNSAGSNDIAAKAAAAGIKVIVPSMLAASGQGNQPFSGQDENQGNSVRVSTTATVYCAWMNPRGRASMPVQARELPASIPLMVIIGTKDSSFGFTEANIYKPATKNPYSKYLVIDGGDHRNTDHSASQRIVDWIKSLP